MTPTNTTAPGEGCIDAEVVDGVFLIGINRPAKRRPASSLFRHGVRQR